MKNGKFILSTAALLVTAAGAFSFKTIGKYARQSQILNGHNSAYGIVTSNGAPVTCTLTTCFTRATGTGANPSCRTVSLGGSVTATFFKTATCTTQSVLTWSSVK